MDTAAPATRPEMALEAVDSGSAAAGCRCSVSTASTCPTDASLSPEIAVGSVCASTPNAQVLKEGGVDSKGFHSAGHRPAFFFIVTGVRLTFDVNGAVLCGCELLQQGDAMR